MPQLKVYPKHILDAELGRSRRTEYRAVRHPLHPNAAGSDRLGVQNAGILVVAPEMGSTEWWAALRAECATLPKPWGWL